MRDRKYSLHRNHCRNDKKSRRKQWVPPLSAVLVTLVLLAFLNVRNNNDIVKIPPIEEPAVAPHRTHATPCRVTSLSDLRQMMKSQDQEDLRLLSFFQSLCGGTYVELGGLDGVLYSNSYLFANAMNWTGVLLELNPSSFAQLQVNRPHDITVHAAVCDSPRTLHWVAAAHVETSGIWEFASPSFRQLWWPNATLEAAEPVACRPLGDLLQEHAPNIHYYDFLSLDIEGAELIALQSIDWSRVGFGVVLVEADQHNESKNMALRAFLVERGYEFLYNHRRSDWFVNKDFDQIYQEAMHS